MKLTMGQAAKQAGISKSTLSRAVNSGKISAEKQVNGSYLIDPAELFRVFPSNRTATPSMQRSATINETLEKQLLGSSIDIEMVRLQTENEALKREVSHLTALIDDLRKDRDDWKQQAAVVKAITDLRPKGGIWALFRRS